MRLVPETALAGLLRNLSRDQALRLLSGLSSALETFSIQSADPGAEGPILQPLRTVMTTAEGNVRLFMPAADAETTGIKVATVPKQGDIRATISLFNQDGSLRGLLSAGEITAFRTALASMTLLVKVSGVSKSEFIIFGAGRQAEWHARLAAILFGDELSKITFVNRSRGRMASMCEELVADLDKIAPNLKIEQLAKQDMSEKDYAEKLRTALQSAGVMHGCTPSTEPLFPYSDLGSGPKFISLIGSYKPHMQEIDSDTLLSGGGKVFVDSKQACLEEAGEIIKAGLGEDSLVEIGDFFASSQQTVTASQGQNVIFKCVGMGIMDMAVADELLKIASAENIGQEVDGF
ncbi:ornithine cyclodeaminase/mu-crystallin family protein [Sarocladium implicatum]|nr:ornithine cyclodeaminase/mu-crystallin family protein [Sarocladium implicatum]